MHEWNKVISGPKPTVPRGVSGIRLSIGRLAKLRDMRQWRLKCCHRVCKAILNKVRTVQVIELMRECRSKQVVRMRGER